MKRLAILLLLLAATTQSFVAQTHVHSAFAGQPAGHQVELADGGAAGDPAPVGGGDHNACLLCQIASHGAAALASHQSIIPAIPQQQVVAALPDTPDPRSLPLSHAWSSRGPPRS